MIAILALVLAAVIGHSVWLDHYAGKLERRITELERQALDRR